MLCDGSFSLRILKICLLSCPGTLHRSIVCGGAAVRGALRCEHIALYDSTTQTPKVMPISSDSITTTVSETAQL